MPQNTRLFYETPPALIRQARITKWVLIIVFGCVFAPIICACFGVLGFLAMGPIGGIATAVVLWSVSLVTLWQLVRRRSFYQLIVENGHLRIGQGRSAVTWQLADVDLIIASSLMAPGAMKLLQALHIASKAHVSTQSVRSIAGFVRVQGQDRTRWVYLPPDEIELCAAELSRLCVNAVYVDTHEIEHEPPSGIPAVAGLILLSRQTRNIALGIAMFGFALAFCAVCVILSILFDPPGRKAPLRVFEICLTAAIGCTGAFWKLMRKRAVYIGQIRDRQSNPYELARPLSMRA